MNFIEIANRLSRERAEADPNVAVLLVLPEERSCLSGIIEQHGGLESEDREQPGLNEGVLIPVQCEDEGAVKDDEPPRCGAKACQALSLDRSLS